ncbi:sigma-70 family RNA polymerase sigma factor [Lederbergia wuyishanensis]|uniref:RNA polymerase sigma-70 factor (ECF subfamily) n=1 Tax=Lederbergia wuyishanensis TaxID=1347903 RepID=A0ABU0D2Z9_9BACI|nr:sigma-70 family RNA polymerase sigma factor [Lederbergia wuyishanensis]MCJ8007087.1 sigma-70 family RNA polymerase sigma factor [Lederbergia wuyishanensis]MDQ0342769.1 RNA polymerase sigma-70 factor (ECF subfamily) [Lederbergia wuyishanensis]
MKSSSANFITRIKKQKEDALDYIINAYMPLVKTIATKILNNMKREDIDECINDVFLTVWQNAHQFQGDTKDFKKWIGIITKYKAIDRYRQAEKQFAREQSDELLEQKASFLQTDRFILQQEEKSELLLAISQLEEIDRNIFVMKYYMELPNNEIAENLGLSKAAVDNRLYRGKKRLATNTKLKEQFL